jgi:hypothetical protein
MTLLDAAILVFLCLVAIGGYGQGFIRSATRLGALLLIGGGVALLLLLVPADLGLPALLIYTAGLLLGTTLLVGTLVRRINRTVSPATQLALWNKLLGLGPALLQGMLLVVLGLGLAHRLAPEPGQQQYITEGMLSGPLLSIFDWLELSLADMS